MNGLLLGLVAFTIVLLTGTYWFRLAKAVAIPDDRTPFVMVFATATFIAIYALTREPGWVGGAAAGLALLGGGLFILTWAVSAQKGGSGALRIGSPLPDFSAPDDAGGTFRLASLKGKPILLKLFRGHW